MTCPITLLFVSTFLRRSSRKRLSSKRWASATSVLIHSFNLFISNFVTNLVAFISVLTLITSNLTHSYLTVTHSFLSRQHSAWLLTSSMFPVLGFSQRL